MIIWTIEASLNLHSICFCLLLLHTIITIPIHRTEVRVNYNYHKCQVFYEELGFLIILFANFFNSFLLHFIRLRHHKWYGKFFFLSTYIYFILSCFETKQAKQQTVSILFFQGIDTEKPLLQLDDYTFTGEYQETMGTAMIFEDITPTDSKCPCNHVHLKQSTKLNTLRTGQMFVSMSCLIVL